MPLSSIFVTNSRGLIWRSDATGNFRNEEQKQFAQAVHHGPFSWWKHGDFFSFFLLFGEGWGKRGRIRLDEGLMTLNEFECCNLLWIWSAVNERCLEKLGRESTEGSFRGE